MVIATPRRSRRHIPDPLKIGGQAAGPGRGNQQVAPKLENKGLKSRIGFSFGVTHETLVGGQLGRFRRRFAKFKGHAPEQISVILLMGGQELVEGLLGGLGHQLGQGFMRMRPSPAFAVVGQIRGPGTEEDCQALALIKRQRHRRSRDIGLGHRFPAARDAGIFCRFGLGRADAHVAQKELRLVLFVLRID